MNRTAKISAAFLVATSVALGGIAFATTASAADWTGAAEGNGSTLRASISDADLATLEALGITVESITVDGGAVTINADQNANMDAAFPDAALDGGGVRAMSLRMIYGGVSYDADKVTSPWSQGQAVSMGSLDALSTGWAGPTQDAITNVSGHSSIWNGGAVKGTPFTVISDDYRVAADAALTDSITASGLKGHNSANLSTATDGTTGVWLQVAALGQGVGTYDGLGEMGIMMSAPIWVSVDTTDYLFLGDALPAEEGFGSGSLGFALPELANWTMDANGKPTATTVEKLDVQTATTVHRYMGTLPAASAWFDYTVVDINANNIFTNVTALPDGTTGITAASVKGGILTNASVMDQGNGSYVYSVDTGTNSPVLADSSFGEGVTVTQVQAFGSMLIVTMKANDGSAIVLGGDAPFGNGGAAAGVASAWGNLFFTENVTYTDNPIVDPPIVQPPVSNPPVSNPPVVDPPVSAPPVVTPVAPPVERFTAKTGLDTDAVAATPVANVSMATPAAGNTESVSVSGLAALVALMAGFAGLVVRRNTSKAKHRA